MLSECHTYLNEQDLTILTGIAYQLTESDPLADTPQCKRDSALMKTLGANSVRVYHVRADQNHDGCMTAFSDAGIYTWIDLDTFDTYILDNHGPPQWTQRQYSAYQKVMDTFQKYDNVAGFFVGNEMLNKGEDSVAAPFIKAAARDMKAYRDSKGYRQIPIGYSAADITALRPNLQNYLACGSNSSETLDFYALNVSASVSGLYRIHANFIRPTNGAESLRMKSQGMPCCNRTPPTTTSRSSCLRTGCNEPPPRTFDDQAAIFGQDMAGTWSGSIVYEWLEETNNYGLISYGPSVAATKTGAGISAGYTRSGTPTPISPDFDRLSSQWATLNPSGVSANAYSANANPPACPAYTSGMWEVSGNAPLPSLGQKAKAYTSKVNSATGGGKGGGSASSTTASSAATSTRSPSISLRKRDQARFWEKLGHFNKEHPVWSFLIWGVVAISGLGLLV